MPFLRKRSQRFAEYAEIGRPDCDLAGSCFEDLSGYPKEVSDVKQIEEFEFLLSYLILFHVNLDFACAVLEVAEQSLAMGPKCNYPSRDPDLGSFPLQLLEVLDYLRCQVRPVEGVGIRVDALFLQFF